MAWNFFVAMCVLGSTKGSLLPVGKTCKWRSRVSSQPSLNGEIRRKLTSYAEVVRVRCSQELVMAPLYGCCPNVCLGRKWNGTGLKYSALPTIYLSFDTYESGLMEVVMKAADVPIYGVLQIWPLELHPNNGVDVPSVSGWQARSLGFTCILFPLLQACVVLTEKPCSSRAPSRSPT